MPLFRRRDEKTPIERTKEKQERKEMLKLGFGKIEDTKFSDFINNMSLFCMSNWGEEMRENVEGIYENKFMTISRNKDQKINISIKDNDKMQENNHKQEIANQLFKELAPNKNLTIYSYSEKDIEFIDELRKAGFTIIYPNPKSTKPKL